MDAGDIRVRLDAYAAAVGFTPPAPHYITDTLECTLADGTELYSDEAHNWCKPCADAFIAKARTVMTEREISENHDIFPTDASISADSPPHCEGCGALLDHVLNADGVAYELDHYAEYPPTEIDGEEAFGIARLVAAAPTHEKAIEIGLAALAIIAQQPAVKPNETAP